jgi:hypothetical protein
MDKEWRWRRCAQFHMNEFKDWDRTASPVMAEADPGELGGEAEIIPAVEKRVAGAIAEIKEEGRYLDVTSASGQKLALRISNASDIEGIPDRSHFKVGMKFSALYEETKQWNEVLEMKVTP